MIVCTCFDGDEDDCTQEVQHDIYGRALGRIFLACKAHIRVAEGLLQTDDADVRIFLSITSFDHRVLQGTHDLLAAAWRFRTHRLSPPLPFDDDPTFRREVERSWLTWLDRQLAEWCHQPTLVRGVMIALVHENTPAGHDAEDALFHEIVHAYADVPWTDNILRLARLATNTARNDGRIASEEP